MSTHGGKWNGLALQLQRTKAQMSLKEVEHSLRQAGYDISMSAIARWERGNRRPSNPDIADALAQIFRCSIITFYRNPILTFDAASEDED